MDSARSPSRGLAAGTLIVALLLLAVWLVVHAQVLAFEFVNWDDDRFVLGVDSIREPSTATWRSLLLTPELGYPIPLTRAWFATLWATFGWNAGAWHAAGLALHLGAVACFAVLARRLLGEWAKALLATAVLLHPVGAEPVAWVAAQKDLLATLFATAAVLVAAGASRGAESAGRLDLRAAIVVTLLMLGLASKPSVALFGLVAAVAWGPVVDAAARKRRRAIALIPTASAAVSALLTVLMQRELSAVREASGLAERLGLIASLTLSAAERLVWPLDLSPTYDVVAAPVASARFALGLALTAAAMCALAWASVRARDAAMRVGAAWVLAAWLPVSGVVGALARGTSDSYVALSLPGVGLMIASWIASVAGRATHASPLHGGATPSSGGATPSSDGATPSSDGAAPSSDGAAPSSGGAAGRRLADWATRASPLLLVAVLAPLRAESLRPWSDSVSLWEHAWEQAGPLPWVCRNLGYAQVFSADGALPDAPEPYLRAHAIWSQCPERNARNLARAEEILRERWGLVPPGVSPLTGTDAVDGASAEGSGESGRDR